MSMFMTFHDIHDIPLWTNEWKKLDHKPQEEKLKDAYLISVTIALNDML